MLQFLQCTAYLSPPEHSGSSNLNSSLLYPSIYSRVFPSSLFSLLPPQIHVRSGEDKKMKTKQEMKGWKEGCFEKLWPEHATGCNTCTR